MASGRELSTRRDPRAPARARRGLQARARRRASTCSRSTPVLGAFPIYFLYPYYNKRTDEYGGSFENRIRFTRELLEMTARGDRRLRDRHAVRHRHAGGAATGTATSASAPTARARSSSRPSITSSTTGTSTSARSNWGEDAGSSRFFDDQPPGRVHPRWPRRCPTKPVVNVGRFTDPDVMVEAITSGQCDIIGAARPSIADPFLPKKIEEGRIEDIRECIGCNVCVSRWESARARSGARRTRRRRGVPPRLAPRALHHGGERRQRRAGRRRRPGRHGVPRGARQARNRGACTSSTQRRGHGRPPALGDDAARAGQVAPG